MLADRGKIVELLHLKANAQPNRGFCGFLKIGENQNRVFILKWTVLQRYLELGAGTGTKQKLSFSTFCLQTHF